MVDIAGILLTGLQQGAIFALLGLGLTIILGTMEFLNLAHGALYLVGAYMGLFIVREVSVQEGLLAGIAGDPTAVGLGSSFLVALILTPILMFVIGVAMERFVARPLYDRTEVEQLLLTFGLALIIEELAREFVGSQPFSSYAPDKLLGFTVGGQADVPLVGLYPRWRFVVIGLAFLLIGLSYLIIERTDFGLIVKAGTRDSEMVRMLGIDITRSYALVFGVGAALAGLAGLVGGTIIDVAPGIGTNNALVPAFLTVVIGGAGSVVGAIAGGIILGMVAAVFQFQAPQWSQIVLFGFVAVFLLVRPGGLFGSVEVGE
ncbi:branched-chain amino acid ABC transporter permease [Halobacteriales archaeon QS_9_67_17]|nr:MAG: branched-chain amino acid ABC transporter permease [Halobacteriales archaeon QS_9_67_17]